MELGVFAVFDSKAQAYLQPFFSVNRGTALREFEGALQNREDRFYRFAEDYVLFELALWDQVKGSFQNVIPADPICRALDIKERADGAR
jgi:Phage ORF5 protein